MGMVTADEFRLNWDKFLEKIRKGAVFVYPTDTIYGIGCNALDESAVKQLRAVKKRKDNPFSVVVPSKKWVYDNCDVTAEAVKWVEKLPGPYTLVLKMSREGVIPKEVNCGLGTLGVRIPKHWFSKVASDLNIPIISTSANIAGEQPMTSIDDLDERIKVDFVVYEGEKKGQPSSIIDLTEKKERITKRQRLSRL